MLKQLLKKQALAALLLTQQPAIRHATGFTGTAGYVLLTPARTYLLTDFRYLEQARTQAKDCRVIDIAPGIPTVLKEILAPTAAPRRLGFISSELSYQKYQSLKKTLGASYTLIGLPDDPAAWRAIKTKPEIAAIKKALAINAQAFAAIARAIKPGITEIALRAKLEIALLQNGAERIGFDTIIASGVRGALPHGVASSKRLKRGELITIDFGGVYQGYHADETCTISLGPPPERLAKIYSLVREAQLRALALVRPGVAAKEVDRAARDYLTAAGYGRYFGHALGHGVGLEVHERPVLSPHSTDSIVAGMVFTIEPGIYIPRLGGVRLEDVVVCTNSGPKIISQIKKDTLFIV